MEITVKITASGEFTEQQLKDYVQTELGLGSCKQDNPFIFADAQLTNIEFD